MRFIKGEHLIWSAIFAVPSFYAWRWLYRTYGAIRDKYREKKLFHERHNCVVMYSRNRIRGWPPDLDMKMSSIKLENFAEPFVYFIDTATKNIDIASMCLAVSRIFKALKRAAKRGVKIRIIINYSSMSGNANKCRNLMKHGVKMAFFIEKGNLMSNIMHCKYMIKDYEELDGYMCMGSLNYSGIAPILNNYEDLVFTTAPHLLIQFTASFENCWKIVSRQNKTPDNVLILSEANLINLIN